MKAALYSGLLAISLMNVANAGMPDDWIVKGSGSIVDGASFSLCSDDQKGCLRYKDRNGGYTRIIKMTERKGDNALEVILELV